MLKQRKVNGQSVSRQLATSSENLVASTQFLVALATSESQFRALRMQAFAKFKRPECTRLHLRELQFQKIFPREHAPGPP